MHQYSESELLSSVQADDEALTLREALQLDYRSTAPERSALVLARLLLFPGERQSNIVEEPPVDTAIAQLMREKLAAGHIAQASVLTNWLLGGGRPVMPLQAYYPLYLYNTDFADTRAIIDAMLYTEPLSPPAYLAYFSLNLFRQILGLTHTAIAARTTDPHELARLFNRLFNDRHAFSAWCTRKHQNIHYYGGATNTILGLYDRFFKKPFFGYPAGGVSAEIAYDLGGGFATSEIERLTGRRFVCADIHDSSLTRHDPEIVLMRYSHPRQFRVIDTAAHDAYVAAQEKIEYLPFDVFEDSFPREARSYFVVSTGFLTSTIRPQKETGIKADIQRLPSLSISIHGIVRIMELVHAGKDVDLFTIQRATSRTYRYKTCYLRWRNGRLETLRTAPDKYRHQALIEARSEGRRLMDPSNDSYAALTGLR